MASSRWKRFAFFDRNNLTLPRDVVDDLLPNSGDGGLDGSVKFGRGLGGGSSRRGWELPNDDVLFPEEESDGSWRDSSLSSSSSSLVKGEYFSLVVTRASLPVSSLSSVGAAAAEQQQQQQQQQQKQKQKQKQPDETTTSSSKTDAEGDKKKAAAAGDPSAVKPKKSSVQSRNGIAGMISTVTACSIPGAGVSHYDLEAILAGQLGAPVGALQCGPVDASGLLSAAAGAVAAGGSGGVSGPVISISSGGTVMGNPAAVGAAAAAATTTAAPGSPGSLSFVPPMVPFNKQPQRKPGEPSAAQASAMDGLVLAFLSSRATNLIHCVDITVRCNPLLTKSSQALASKSSLLASRGAADDDDGTTYGRAADADDDEADATHEETPADLEELDGWRGHYEPFAPLISPVTPAAAAPSTSTPMQPDSQPARIVGLAVCVDNSANPSGDIHVASITDSKVSAPPLSQVSSSLGDVALHVNPHLHLSCVSPQSALVNKRRSAASSSRACVTFRPSAPFDSAARGNPRVVDVVPHVVAVGTDAGRVCVYTYGVTPTFTTPGSSKRAVAVGGKMTLAMEIPPPPSSSGGRCAVSSVQLVTTTSTAPAPATTSTTSDSAKKKATLTTTRTRLFVTYRRLSSPTAAPDPPGEVATLDGGTVQRKKTTTTTPSENAAIAPAGSGGGGGVRCYDLGNIGSPASGGGPIIGGPSARYDLDGRDVSSSCLCDGIVVRKGAATVGGADDAASGHSDGAPGEGGEGQWNTAAEEDIPDHYMVATSDGLYTYSYTKKVGVSPIDGSKLAICAIPPTPTAWSSDVDRGRRSVSAAMLPNPDIARALANEAGASYALVASTDSKSGRDAVDIYDSKNKLVAFHVLLSPGHKALRAQGVTTPSSSTPDGRTRGGRSSAVVLTSGGSIVTLTEKVTFEKVALLVQKNLYSAAVSMAFSDAAYQPEDITALYRRHAEHLYRKGDFAGSMDQYIYTIGSLEPSHVILRFLDAPKIPLLAKYLEALRSRGMATTVHNELLRTCYLKLNDVEAAEKIAASLVTSKEASSMQTVVSSLTHNPTEALATICSFEAPQAVEALIVYGGTLARALPRETAGVVISLCDGTYSPSALADIAAGRRGGGGKDFVEGASPDSLRPQVCDQYPFHLFASAFLENSRLMRLMLAHFAKNGRELTPCLRRALLELTLEEWNHAKRINDAETERIRRNEAVGVLTGPYADEIGNYEALVIVQLAGFFEGELLLYERLQMAPMLLERYAADGGERARRQMLALCRSDPELLADVLGYFVKMAANRQKDDNDNDNDGVRAANDEGSEDATDATEADIFDDIREALFLAKSQGVLPPVRIARILAGEGTGEFSNDSRGSSLLSKDCVHLSVALDYIGAILDESSKEIARLQSDVDEYNKLCNDMEEEIEQLLQVTTTTTTTESVSKKEQQQTSKIDVDKLYKMLREAGPDALMLKVRNENSEEEFWREMEQSEDRFGTIARFFARGIIN